MKQYKIGEFAKYMGVSKDLVKHYQTCGIIEPDVNEENSYRHYNMRHGERILQSRKYRSLGFSVDDAKHIVYERTASEMFDTIRSQTDEIDNQIAKLTMKKVLLEQLHQQFEMCQEKKGTCERVRLPKQYFLPHIEENAFCEKKEIVEQITNWMKHIEYAYKTARVTMYPEWQENDHGLLMEEQYFVKLELPVIDDMIIYEEGDYIVYYVRERYVRNRGITEYIEQYYQYVKECGHSVKKDGILMQHIFDHYEDGVRYVNYRVIFKLDSGKE
ncbi:predicted transcriptional regulators [Lachnospiraceae bacterium KM106-2]|nr:predicted transcriptional regulators [Lachnospiraceae bacterium KM106-2]